MERFVVSDPNGTPEQRYKWLWEDVRQQNTLLCRECDKAVARVFALEQELRAERHQREHALRERDTYAAALAQAHKVAVRYEALLSVPSSMKNSNQ